MIPLKREDHIIVNANRISFQFVDSSRWDIQSNRLFKNAAHYNETTGNLTAKIKKEKQLK